MSENEKKEIREKKDTIRIVRFSRRQFLQRTGLAAGGAVIASIGLASACGSSTNTTSPTSPGGSTTLPTSSSTTPTSSLPPSSSAPPTSDTPTATPSATATNTVPITTYNYVPPTALPPLLAVADTECTVANDGRVYSAEHVWVKSLSTDIAVMGITTTYVELIAFPNQISLSKIGDVLIRGDIAFAEIEGYKLDVDIISPVSGMVIQVNDFLLSFNKSTELEPLMNSTYNGGWLVVVQLSKPDELKSLMSAQSYRDLIAKK